MQFKAFVGKFDLTFYALHPYFGGKKNKKKKVETNENSFNLNINYESEFEFEFDHDNYLFIIWRQ